MTERSATALASMTAISTLCFTLTWYRLIASQIAHAKLNDVEMYGDEPRVVQSMCRITSAYSRFAPFVADAAGQGELNAAVENSSLYLPPTKARLLSSRRFLIHS